MSQDDRLPPILPAQWTPEQRACAEEIIAGPRGGLISPFVPMLRSPELTVHSQRMGEYLRYRSAVGLRLSELAILLVARHWTQQVEWAIHAPIALLEGIAAETVAAIALGERPRARPADEAVVYDFSTELLEGQQVSDATWARAVAALGEQGVVDLVAINGYYGYLAMLMNAART
ncbi:MAG: carboxymuconolactone decarboxylase family protein, partial [Burkholderiales bacterium]